MFFSLKLLKSSSLAPPVGNCGNWWPPFKRFFPSIWHWAGTREAVIRLFNRLIDTCFGTESPWWSKGGMTNPTIQGFLLIDTPKKRGKPFFRGLHHWKIEPRRIFAAPHYVSWACCEEARNGLLKVIKGQKEDQFMKGCCGNSWCTIRKSTNGIIKAGKKKANAAIIYLKV